MKLSAICLAAAAVVALCAVTPASQATNIRSVQTKRLADHAIKPVMAKYAIPGMAVGVVVEGKPYVFNYGVAAKKPQTPVSRDTLFEIGSISKTFTATLASYAQVRGDLSLSDPTSKYLPSLRGHPFGDVSLLELGTHTPGGLPLQVPDTIHGNDQLMQYFKAWEPSHAPGTYRTYNNIGIGTLGLITAKSMGRDFIALMQNSLFPALGMSHTWINIPHAQSADYAQGYTQQGKPIRLVNGVLSSEAYGVKTTAADMLRFIQANMGLIKLNGKLQHAITATHTGYFKAGVMTQDLIWEQYDYPVRLKTLLAGNSRDMIFEATPATEIKPPQQPKADAWINKTGSTNGFSTYVAFIPNKRLGIVILANKSFPIHARVTVAYRILAALDDRGH